MRAALIGKQSDGLLEVAFEDVVAEKAEYKVHHDIKRNEQTFKSGRNGEWYFAMIRKCKR